jgi:TolA-binding protein
MIVWRRRLLILFVMLAGGARLFAAGQAEQRAYDAAAKAFHDGFYSRAEMGLSNFIAKYPASTNVPEVALLQAQAQFKQGKLTNAIAVLNANKARAGNLADQYVYWIGEAQFADSNFLAAAETFVSLAQDFRDSPLRLRAVIEAAVAREKLGDWPQIIALLEETNGVFQLAAQTKTNNELVLRGQLLLAQAKFARKDFAGAAEVLKSINFESLPPQLQWQWAFQFFHVRLAAGNLNAALAVANNLLEIAQLENDDARRAEAASLKAEVLELLGRPDEAIAAYRENVTTNAPDRQQQQALLQEAELAVAHGLTNATQPLEEFLAQFTNSPARDIVLLTLGELNLKAAAGPPLDTNGLQAAQARFDQFLGALTNATPAGLAGRAHLDRGWCLWLAGKIPQSLDDFKAAADTLPPSEGQAVARFKIADVLFDQTNFAGAVENYRAVLDDFRNLPDVVRALGDRALYQILRACLELKDEAGAGAALAQMVKQFPASSFAPGSALLYGEGLADWREPAAAREQFQKFETEFPGSPLRAQAQLAIARTYEQERDWPDAIAGYESWLKNFPTNVLRPQAGYALALADARAGDEAGAFMEFSNLVAQFPANQQFAPLAQWWVAGYFYGTGTNYADAEKNYELVFQNTNWQDSPLVYRARLMAGNSAMARFAYSDARRYFADLIPDTNCPTDVRLQANFADGDALMRMDSTDTNNPLANFQRATNVFSQTSLLDPTNGAAALLADCKIGDCDLQLANYDAATNAYGQVFYNTNAAAGVTLRSRAQVGFGIALEKKATQVSGTNQTALLEFALNNYLDVLYRDNLRDDEKEDPFWVQKAGLQAARLVENLGKWQEAVKIYQRLEEELPQLRDSLEKKIAAAQEQASAGKN